MIRANLRMMLLASAAYRAAAADLVDTSTSLASQPLRLL